MANKQIQIPFRRSVVALFFIIWGAVWLFFSGTGVPGNIFGGFFIIIGAVFFAYSFREVLQYKKTGEVKTRSDERSELSGLRASRNGFEFLLISTAILTALWGFKLINEIAFLALIGPVFAIGVAVYILSYYMHERRGE
jgi:Ca2+/Na+ antiporter